MDDSLARTVSRPDKVNETNPTVVAAVGFSLHAQAYFELVQTVWLSQPNR